MISGFHQRHSVCIFFVNPTTKEYRRPAAGETIIKFRWRLAATTPHATDKRLFAELILIPTIARSAPAANLIPPEDVVDRSAQELLRYLFEFTHNCVKNPKQTEKHKYIQNHNKNL